MHTKSHLFKKTNISNKVNAGGPAPEDQLLALANDQYWIVLNSDKLGICDKGSELCDRANALKHALQTYGPNSTQLPDLRQNEGKAKGHIFHGHVIDRTGTTYIMEWAIIDLSQRIMALVGFDTHENYRFHQKPLDIGLCQKVLSDPKNIKIIKHTREKAEEAKEKVERIEKNYRKC